MAQGDLFKVCLCNFECDDLTLRDGAVATLQIDFGQRRTFKTDAEVVGRKTRWNFRAGFQIELQAGNLTDRNLKVTLTLKDGTMIADALIDLGTVAVGPPQYKLTLRGRQAGEESGFVSFTCVMQMVSPDLTVTCKSLRLFTPEGDEMPARLRMSCSLEETDDKATVLTLPFSQNGSWYGPCSLSFTTTLATLLGAPPGQRLHFVVGDDQGQDFGAAFVPFRTFFSLKDGEDVPFRVPVSHDFSCDNQYGAEVAQVAELAGVVRYQNVPTVAQMVGGCCFDGRIENSFLLTEGLPFPAGLPACPEVWKDPALQHHLGSVLCVGPNLHQEVTDQGVDLAKLGEALEVLELPLPWQMRKERSGLGGRRYFADPRARRTTWVDPRFLPEGWEQRIDPESGRVYFQCEHNQTTTFVDPRCCPDGWDMRVSKNGPAYFVHAESMQTTFQDPRGLPSYVEPALDSQARMFFRDHKEKTTSWKDPRLKAGETTLALWKQSEALRWWYREAMQRMDVNASDLP